MCTIEVIKLHFHTPSRPVSCKLLAKPDECSALAGRFDIPELMYLSANVTLERSEMHCIEVTGKS